MRSEDNQTEMATASGLKIGKILGIPIYLHISWFPIFAFITYELTQGFHHANPAWSEEKLWAVGISTSILFFGSVVFHELSHSVIAQHYKIRVVSITLFLFGGIARIGREPSSAKQEFNIAVAGPLSSYSLSALFFGLMYSFPHSEIVGTSAAWLGWINLGLATFNLLPGFPLDGGRIFRAIVWGVKKDFSAATKIAGTTGKVVAYGMIAIGGWYCFRSQWDQGLWLVVLGYFLLNAAQESVAQLAVRETLAGLFASDVMSNDVPSITRDTSLEEYGAEVLRTGRRCHLVVTEDRLVGLMNVHALNSIPRDEWTQNSVQAVMIPRDRILWAAPEEPLLRLLERLLAADINQMPVVSSVEEGDTHVVGMVTRDSILRVMQTRAELGAVPTKKALSSN